MGTRPSLRPLWDVLPSTRQSLRERAVPNAVDSAIPEMITADLGERVDVGAVQPSITMLFDVCGAQATSLASRLLDGDRQQAEAVVFTVFVEVSRALPHIEYTDIVELCGFTLRSVRRCCLALRSPEKATIVSLNRAPETRARATTVPAQVRAALTPLSFEQRRAVELAYDGRTSTEIASFVTGETAHHVNRRRRFGPRRRAHCTSADGADLNDQK